MSRFRCALLVLTAACAPTFAVPEGTLVTCERDGDCPADLPVCATTRLCVSRDIIGADGPRVLSATPASPTTIVVQFDVQLLDGSVSDTGSYRIAGLTVVAGALRADKASVLLETSTQVPAVSYRLDASGVRDLAGHVAAEAVIDFRGFGLSPDELAPDQVTPPDNAQLLGTSALLSWSGRAAATTYLVEVSRDQDFDTLVVDVIAVAAPATSTPVRFDSDGTYYWRVTSDVQSATADTPQRAFHLFTDKIYVACPDDTSDCAGGFGTRQKPYRRIDAALRLSEDLGAHDVLVAGRAQPYLESLVVRGSHGLACGYDAAFTERNSSAHPTTITSTNAVGALFVSGSTGFDVAGCDFRDARGTAAVSIVGSTATLSDVDIYADAYDDVAALSVLDSQVTVHDGNLRLVVPTSAQLGRSSADAVSVLRTDRSEVQLIDTNLAGTISLAPAAIDATASNVHLEGVLVETGDRPGGEPTSNATGITLRNGSTLEMWSSRVHIGRGFTTATGIDMNNASAQLLQSLVLSAGTNSGYAIRYTGSGNTELANVVLFGGISGTATALDATLTSGTFSVYHSLLIASPGGTTPAAIVRVSDPVTELSCAPYSFAFVNDIFVANNAGLGNCLLGGVGDADDARLGTLVLHNAFVTTAAANALRAGDIVNATEGDFGCADDSQGNAFLNRTLAQVFTNLAGADGDPATLADNDYAPSGMADRAALRVGIPTSGMCASQACLPVTFDLTSRLRTTSPPSAGPYDLP